MNARDNAMIQQMAASGMNRDELAGLSPGELESRFNLWLGHPGLKTVRIDSAEEGTQMSYLDDLRAAARQRNRDAAIKLINSRSDGHELGTLAFLNAKSDDYIFARLDAITRGEEDRAPVRASSLDGYGVTERMREDARQAAPSGPYGMGGYNLDFNHSGGDAAEAAYQRSKGNLNAGRADRAEGTSTATAAEKAKAETGNVFDPDTDAEAARKAKLEEATEMTLEAQANEAWNKANARLAASHPSQQKHKPGRPVGE